MLDVPREPVGEVAKLLRAEWRARGTRKAPGCAYARAALVLTHIEQLQLHTSC
jgi:hypothetical protein